MTRRQEPNGYGMGIGMNSGILSSCERPEIGDNLERKGIGDDAAEGAGCR